MNGNILDLFNRLDVEIVGGEGNILISSDGTKYLDFISGVGVNQLGYSDSLLKIAINKTNNVIHLPLHFNNHFSSELASTLVQHSTIKDGKVFFCTSGSEANEAFIKFLHKTSSQCPNNSRTIVSFSKSFHGRTLGSINLTRQDSVRSDYNVDNGFNVVELPFNDIDAFNKFTSYISPIAVIIEPVQGSGGVNIASEDFLLAINDYCNRNNAFFAIDEVQSGMGRTGTLFASSKYKLNPDYIMFGKGTGGGMPLAGVISGIKVSPYINKGDHGTTWCNPFLSAALGLETINFIFKENILSNVLNRSLDFQKGLAQIKKACPKIIKDIRISGLMIGLEFDLNKDAVLRLQKSLLNKNIIVDVTQGNTIRLLPPLTINEKDVNTFLLALKEILKA